MLSICVTCGGNLCQRITRRLSIRIWFTFLVVCRNSNVEVLVQPKTELLHKSHLSRCLLHNTEVHLTLNLLTTTIVAPPSNASKWQMGFNSAFKGLNNVFSHACGRHKHEAI